jgi:hypothetical protein
MICKQEDVEEVTWQTFKGELTERQQKTLGKIHKYNEKVVYHYMCTV